TGRFRLTKRESQRRDFIHAQKAALFSVRQLLDSTRWVLADDLPALRIFKYGAEHTNSARCDALASSCHPTTAQPLATSITPGHLCCLPSSDIGLHSRDVVRT